jgi:hypothetical protein
MAKLVLLCMLHGEKCRFQKLKTFMKKTNHPMEAKLCTNPDPCNQQYLTTDINLTVRGKCEKASQCRYPSKACKLAYNKGAPLMRSRWLFCYYGKESKTLKYTE